MEQLGSEEQTGLAFRVEIPPSGVRGSVPIIAMTASGGQAVRSVILNAGFQAWPPKPFAPHTLFKNIPAIFNAYAGRLEAGRGSGALASNPMRSKGAQSACSSRPHSYYRYFSICCTAHSRFSEKE